MPSKCYLISTPSSDKFLARRRGQRVLSLSGTRAAHQLVLLHNHKKQTVSEPSQRTKLRRGSLVCPPAWCPRPCPPTRIARSPRSRFHPGETPAASCAGSASPALSRARPPACTAPPPPDSQQEAVGITRSESDESTNANPGSYTIIRSQSMMVARSAGLTSTDTAEVHSSMIAIFGEW